MTPTPSPEPNYDTWLTKKEAASAIGVSTKTVEELMKRQTVRYVADYYRLIGGQQRRITIFNPDDVRRLADKRNQPKTELLPAATGNGHHEPTKSLTPATSQELLKRLEAMAAKFVVPASQRASHEGSQTSDLLLLNKVFLTIPEAVRLTGRSAAYLRRRCQDGSLKAVKDGGWRIRRARLQKL